MSQDKGKKGKGGEKLEIGEGKPGLGKWEMEEEGGGRKKSQMDILSL